MMFWAFDAPCSRPCLRTPVGQHFGMRLLRSFPVVFALALSVEADAGTALNKEIRSLLTRSCHDCHDAKTQKGELNLERFDTLEKISKEPAIWDNALRQILDGEMPPRKKRQLTPEEKTRLTNWIETTLDNIALANAGDPGPVVLRRLSNREFTYTIHDLTGVASLEPARDLPPDGAAGEGFSNVGAALAMSPGLLTKYLDAAKDIASHAVILPDRIAFSPSDSRADWTHEKLQRIRALHARHSEIGGAAEAYGGVAKGVPERGTIPLEKYLRALKNPRQETLSAPPAPSPKYLATLEAALENDTPSPMLDPIRARWRQAGPDDLASIVKEIEAWQRGLWRFAKIGHIGKRDGPPAWQIPIMPLATTHLIRLKLNPARTDTTLFLAAGNAGDGAHGDIVLWRNPALTLPGGKSIPLTGLDSLNESIAANQESELRKTSAFLDACAEAFATKRSVRDLAEAKKLNPDLAEIWNAFVGLGAAPSMTGSLLAGENLNIGGYAFVRGIGNGLPTMLVNQSDSAVSFSTLTVPSRAVTVHPTPDIDSIVVWRSPFSGRARVRGFVADADNKCGNGVVWRLEFINGAGATRLAAQALSNGGRTEFAPDLELKIQPGDLLKLTIAARDRNHVCDTSQVALTIIETIGEKRAWDLASDVVDRIGEGNPMKDSFGNRGVWSFRKSETVNADKTFAIPGESALGRWRTAVMTGGKTADSTATQTTLLAPALAIDKAVAAEVRRWRGPFGWLNRAPQAASKPTDIEQTAPSNLRFTIPGELLSEGAEFTASVGLHPEKGANGSAQALASLSEPTAPLPLSPGAILPAGPGSGRSWTAEATPVISDRPILVHKGSEAEGRFRQDIAAFQSLFPAALCYNRIIPVDEVVTLTLRHREDHHLRRLMLNDAQAAELDQLWDELQFISRQPLRQLDAFKQLWQFATQDADPSAFEPMRKPIQDAADAFEKRLIEVEPKQIDAALGFAEQAWRRPLEDKERGKLRSLYKTLRMQGLDHENSLRQLLARALVAPAFLYRGEQPPPGKEAAPVGDWELATRLSYFLWSSGPDAELRRLAAAGRLRDPETLTAQTRRMLGDAKIRRLATEFGAQWLQVRDLDTLEEKSERHFPTFAGLRGAMLEEITRFFADLFANDRSVLSLIDSDHTFLNPELAEHYGIDFAGDAWRRIDGQRSRGRGGILGFAGTLARHSGASRTSPILRGNWVSEVLLGDRLPRPPKGVPILPDEAPEGETVRQMIERHSTDPACARCHERIDPLGFALENFDAIGRARSVSDTAVTLSDGVRFDGLNGLSSYILNQRRDDFVLQFCRKLLGYALGRGVQLSDKPLLNEMTARLGKNGFRVQQAVEAIVQSPQFRNVRGRDFAE